MALKCYRNKQYDYNDYGLLLLSCNNTRIVDVLGKLLHLLQHTIGHWNLP